MELRIIKTFTTQLIIVAALAFLATGCYYDVEEVLYPGGCNTETVTYRGTVLPILQRECYTCHDNLSQNGGISLEGYTKLRVTVDNGSLLGAIRHEPGFSAMPDGRAKLDACSIEKIEKWIEAGADDN